MSIGIRASYEPLRVLDHAAIGAVYIGVGTPTQNPMRQFIIKNLTDVTLVFSWDGINDWDMLPKTGYYISDICSNKSTNGGMLELPENERLYVKQYTVPPTKGEVTFSVMYANNE
jgi:hypothetical protein